MEFSGTGLFGRGFWGRVHYDGLFWTNFMGSLSLVGAGWTEV